MREGSGCFLVAETLCIHWWKQLVCISDKATLKQTFIDLSESSMIQKKNKNPRSVFESFFFFSAVATQILNHNFLTGKDFLHVFLAFALFSSSSILSCFFRVYLCLRARVLLCAISWDHLTLHKTGNRPTSRYMMSSKYVWKLFSRTTFSSSKPLMKLRVVPKALFSI